MGTFHNVPGLLSSGESGSDFAGFLSLLAGWEVPVPSGGWRKSGIVTPAPGCFGVAWRVLDAQYTRVPEFPRAIPQRRRRLFVVGHLGSWERPAQVLFDGEMFGGDTPPRRTKRAAAAAGAEIGADPAKWWNGSDLADTLTCTSHNQLMPDKAQLQCVVENGHGVFSESGNAAALRASGGTNGGGSESLICLDMRQIEAGGGDVSPTLISTDYTGGKAICFENHGQDSRVSEIKVAPVLSAKAGTGGNNLPLVLEDALGFIKNDAGGIQQCYADGVFPTMRSQVTPAVAIAENIIGRKVENGGNGVGAQEELSYTLNCTGVHGVAQNASVRRLLPVECERLMGFPDHHTRIPWKGLPEEECPDAPRYKACGNSMCVNVMAWIGQRIQAAEDEIQNEENSQ